MNREISFGSIDMKTGEMLDGYIDKKGKMQLKKKPFWKRWFKKEPLEKEFLGVTTMEVGYVWGQSSKVNAPVYKIYNPFTRKIKKIYTEYNGLIYYFNIDAYEKIGKLI